MPSGPQQLAGLEQEHSATDRRFLDVLADAAAELPKARLAALGESQQQNTSTEWHDRIERVRAAVDRAERPLEDLASTYRNATSELDTQTEELQEALAETPAERAAEAAWHANFWAHAHGVSSLPVAFRRILPCERRPARRIIRVRAARSRRRARTSRARSPGREPEPDPPVAAEAA